MIMVVSTADRAMKVSARVAESSSVVWEWLSLVGEFAVTRSVEDLTMLVAVGAVCIPYVVRVG